MHKGPAKLLNFYSFSLRHIPRIFRPDFSRSIPFQRWMYAITRTHTSQLQTHLTNYIACSCSVSDTDCECRCVRYRNVDARVTKIERILAQLNCEKNEKKATAIWKLAFYQLTVPFANVWMNADSCSLNEYKRQNFTNLGKYLE